MNASGNHYTTSHRDPLQASSLCLRAEQQIGIEAAVVAGVACRADLVDLEQHRVAVAVQPDRVHVLGVTGRLTQYVHSVRLDCDGDTVLLEVDQVGAACHTGDHSCFDADLLLGPEA